MIEKRCYDETLHASNCSGLFSPVDAIVRFSYDDRGRQVFRRHFHADGRATRTLDGYPHAQEFRYREDGRVAEERFYDLQGNPDVAFGSVARKTFTYTSFGQLADTTRYGYDGQPAASRDGCHRLHYEYDARRRLRQIECLDSQDKPTNSKAMVLGEVTWPEGAARVVIRRGNTPANVFFDAAGSVLRTVDCAPPDTRCYR